MNWQITNATVVFPDGPRKVAGCSISDGIISEIFEQVGSQEQLLNLDLHGLFIYPGLINGHDSLMGTYDAFRGENWPYLNWLAFDTEMKTSSVFRERMLIDSEYLYTIGAFRNLLSGVTTVVDHIPEFVRAPFYDHLPIDLLKNYAISHSICSYSLGWGDEPDIECDRALSENIPYITKIGEGSDRESRESFLKLDRMGCVHDHTVLIHGLALSPDDLERMAEEGTHLVWCPTSNQYLYDKIAPIREALEKGVNVALGTDRSMAGSINMMEELRSAAKLFQDKYNQELSPEILFHMTTDFAAKAFRMTDRGIIAPGKKADLLILRGKYALDPYSSLLEANPEDVFLLIKDGNPIYGDSSLKSLFDQFDFEYDSVLVNNREKYLIHGLFDALQTIDDIVGTPRSFKFLPVKLRS